MTFYEIEIQRNNEDIESKGIFSYATKDEAIATFHSKMASGITQGIAGNLKYVMNMVINEYGNAVVIDRWTAPEPEPEPPVNPEEPGEE